MNIYKKSLLEQIAESAGKHPDVPPTERTETAHIKPGEPDLIEYLSEQLTEQNEPEQDAEKLAKDHMRHVKKSFDYCLYMIEKLEAEK